MKKSFSLHVAGKDDARVLEAIKGDVRKYLKRERRKPVKTGVDFWDFDCRFGASADNATEVHFATILPLVDAAAKDGADSFYLELLVKEGRRTQRPRALDTEHEGQTSRQDPEPLE